ncbi:periaxin-like [Macrobrachium rosenbergii]|uniref:periaxin-like n=1 Tax=Macrobrachium rosenbergii TaxID=79674 RepID=UPI0034D58BDE
MDLRKLVGLVILIHLAAGASEDDSVEAIKDGNNSSKKGIDEEVSVPVPIPTQLNLSSETQPGLQDSYNTGLAFPNSSAIKTTNVSRFQEPKTPDIFQDISLQVSNNSTHETGRNFMKLGIPKNRRIIQMVPPNIRTNLNIPHIYRRNKQDIEKQELPVHRESGTLNLQKLIFPKFSQAENTPDHINIPKNHYFPNVQHHRLPKLHKEPIANPQIPGISLPPKPFITPVELPIPQLSVTSITRTPRTSSPEIEDIPELKLSAIGNLNNQDNTISEGLHFPTVEHPEISTENISAIINTLINNLGDLKVPQIIEITLSPITQISPVELPTRKLPLINTSVPTPELELPGVNKPNYPGSSVLNGHDLLNVEHRQIPELNTSEIVNLVTQNLSDINIPQTPDFNIPSVPTIAPKELPIPELPLTNNTHIPQISSPQIQNVPELEVPAVNIPNYPDIPSPEGQDLPVVEHPRIPEINMSTIVNPVLQNISDTEVQQTYPEIPVLQGHDLPNVANPVIQNMSDTKLPSIPDTSLSPTTAITPTELPIPNLPVIPQISRPQMTDIPEVEEPAIIKPDDLDIPVLESHDPAEVEHTKMPDLNIPTLATPVIQNISDTEVQQSPDFNIPSVPTLTPVEPPIPNFPFINDTYIPQFSDPETQEIPKLKLTAIIKPNDPNGQDILIVEHPKLSTPNISAIISPFIQNVSDSNVTQTPDLNISPFPTISPEDLTIPTLPVTNVTHIPQISISQSDVNLPETDIPNYPDIPMLEGQDLPNAENHDILEQNTSTIVNPVEIAQIPDIDLPPVPTISPEELPLPDLQFPNITHTPEISGPQTQDILDLNLTAIVKPSDLVIISPQSQDFPIAEHPEMPELNTSTTVDQIIHDVGDEGIPQIPDTTLSPIATIPPAELPVPNPPLTNITDIPQISSPQIIDIPELKQPAIIEPDDPAIPILESDDHPEVQNPQIPELPIQELPVTNFTQIPQIQNIPELQVTPISEPNYPDTPSPKSQLPSCSNNIS